MLMRHCPHRSVQLACTVIMALFAAGCASVWPAGSGTPAIAALPPELADCAAAFNAADRSTASMGVRDAQDSPVFGFPWLRSNRHLASYADELATPNSVDTWLSRLRERDIEARTIEALNGHPDQRQMLARLDDCGRRLIHHDRDSPERLAAIRAAAAVPDSYSSAARALGLYPLTRMGVAAGVARWEDSASRRLARPPAFDPQTPTIRYGIDHSRRGDALLARLMSTRRVDSLGITVLTDDAQAWLLAEHAPDFIVAQGGPFDEIGRIGLDTDARPMLDPNAPAIYARVAHTRHGDRSLIQLVYTVWFNERPARGPLDIYAGQLDGVTVRLTLDRQGRPAVIDSIHPCGCYHLFVATGVARPRPVPDDVQSWEEWRFMPTSLPMPGTDQRLVVSIDSASHQVSGLSFEATSTSARRQATLVSADRLRSLPLGDASTPTRAPRSRSLYRADGLVAGSERLERFILWPMGIRSAGAMRQWGHQATAFVGRRHFDDARLIEERFDIP